MIIIFILSFFVLLLVAYLFFIHFPKSERKEREKDDRDVTDRMYENEGLCEWISADAKPPYNLGVLVFIPEEDFHITSGMWDISNKWVLLDEYRKPSDDAPVTHWMHLPEIPAEYIKERNEQYETLKDLKKYLKPTQ